MEDIFKWTEKDEKRLEEAQKKVQQLKDRKAVCQRYQSIRKASGTTLGLDRYTLKPGHKSTVRVIF